MEYVRLRFSDGGPLVSAYRGPAQINCFRAPTVTPIALEFRYVSGFCQGLRSRKHALDSSAGSCNRLKKKIDPFLFMDARQEKQEPPISKRWQGPF